MSLAYPWILAFPILILLAKHLSGNMSGSQIAFPDQELYSHKCTSWKIRVRKPLLYSLSLISIFLLSFAAARPQLITSLPAPERARNLMIALDVSGSMKTRDFQIGGQSVNRLAAVKHVVQQFIAKRAGDRIGLAIFGSQAFLESPLTLDHKLIAKLIKNLAVGIAGDGTAIGDGLALSLKRIQSVPADTSAVILLTDGVNTSGQIDPQQAAEIAKDLGVKIHTIGIGSNNRQTRPSYLDVLQPKFEFDEKLLKSIANKSSGSYFHASNISGLEKVYESIDQLERFDTNALEQIRVEELFLPYLLIGVLCYLLYLILCWSVFMAVP